MASADQQLRFSQLVLSNWRQFGLVDIGFHPRLTVLTGANASGKTTILNLLGRHFNWVTQYLGTPKRSYKGDLSWQVDTRSAETSAQRQIGQLVYTNGVIAPLIVPPGNVTYDVQLGSQQFVPGLYLSSHRALSAYQQLPSIPSQFSAADQIFSSYFNEISNRYRGTYTGRTPLMQMKESLMAAALYGHGSNVVRENPEAREVWNGFQDVLRILSPKSLNFDGLLVQPPEILIHTKTGDFLIDAVSGGASSLIEIGWQIFLRSREYESFTVCMDEPENHLHPQLQRSIIPSLLNAFPHIDFIVATHSPFIVTSVSDSNVYVLDYEDGAVVSRLLDTINKSASSDEILRRVLGLETTAPLWVENRLAQILSHYQADQLTADDFRQLRNELQEIGLDREFPAALGALTSDESDAPTD